MIKAIGVVASSADDWALKEVVWIYSTAIVFLGLAAAFAGTWLEKVGPRMVGLVAAFCWGGGFLIGSVGIINHQLWLIYLGYGVLGGCGLGLGYVSPVSTFIPHAAPSKLSTPPPHPLVSPVTAVFAFVNVQFVALIVPFVL